MRRPTAPRPRTPGTRRVLRPTLAGPLALVALLAAGCRGAPLLAPGDPLVPVGLGGHTFRLEVAADPTTRYQGLSDREEIAEDGGMLFVYPSPRPVAFVMRRCRVPIDVAFLDGDGRIVAWHAMAVEPDGTPPAVLRRYPSGAPARYVVEVRGGTLAALGVRVGDRVDLPWDRLPEGAD